MRSSGVCMLELINVRVIELEAHLNSTRREMLMRAGGGGGITCGQSCAQYRSGVEFQNEVQLTRRPYWFAMKCIA